MASGGNGIRDGFVCVFSIPLLSAESDWWGNSSIEPPVADLATWKRFMIEFDLVVVVVMWGR